MAFALLFLISCSDKKISSGNTGEEYHFSALPDSMMMEEGTASLIGVDYDEPWSYEILNSFRGRLRFKRSGEGASVVINLYGTGVNERLMIMPGMIVRTEEEHQFRDNRIYFRECSFPFSLYLRFEARVDNSLYTDWVSGEMEIRINQPGKWRVDIYQ